MNRPKYSNIYRSTTYNTSTSSDINQLDKPTPAVDVILIGDIIAKVVKYFPKLKLWSFIKMILDTGTTKYMTGNKDLFAKVTLPLF